MTRRRLLVGCFLSLFAMPVQSQAIWSLNAVFNDQSTISGTFSYNAMTNVFGSINVASSNGNQYFQVNPESPGNSTFLSFLAGPWQNGTPAFIAQLSEQMTNAGGTIDIVPSLFSPVPGSTGLSFEGRCAGGTPCGSLEAARGVVSGRISTTVPEPGTLAMLGLGFTVLGLSQRRKR